MEKQSEVAKYGDSVEVHFTCTLEDGSVFDSSVGREPLQFTIGESQFIQGFDHAVIGMSPGESKTVKIPAIDAYGPRRGEFVHSVSRSQFPDNIMPEVGMKLQIEQENGETSSITVTDVSESHVTMDANHPLAGKDLIFDIQLTAILRPGPDAATHYALGVMLQGKNYLDEAIDHYQRAIRIAPGFVAAYYNLGVAFQNKNLLDEAVTCYRRTIELTPDNADAYHNMGVALKENAQLEEALHCLQKALELKPDYANAHYNIGNTLVAMGQYNEAMNSYRKAVGLKEDYAEAHWNIALLNLLFGNFKAGWEGYEWRWKLDGILSRRDFSRPLWDGSDIKGRTIFLNAEQGLGDTIQFIRYAPMVADKGAKVIIECQKELISLLNNMPGVERIIAGGDPLPDFDVHCPLQTLPSIFGTTIENIPAGASYLAVDPAVIRKWSDRIGSHDAGIKVGLAWSGDPELRDDRNRSCRLETFSALSRFGKVAFYSLQKGRGEEQAKNPPEGMRLLDFTDEIEDFSDTAALIQNLDLVISVDTAVAHLAGALGKPVWVLLPFVPDWRWMLNREDSPWYPTIRLFRQPTSGAWGSVIENVANELEVFIKARTPQ